MQYVNDDIDELFRRAAEDYPLDTKSADWNKVLAGLKAETDGKNISGGKGNKNGRLLWLLLLLPLGLICNQLYSPGTANTSGLSKANLQDETVRSVTKNEQTRNDGTNNTTSNASTAITTTIGQEKIFKNKNEDVNAAKTLPSLSQKTASPLNKSRLQLSTKANYNDDISINSNFENTVANSDVADAEPFYQRAYVYGINFSKGLGVLSPNSVSSKFNPIANSSEQTKKPIRVARQKKFYAGLIGGVDFSTVKFQKVENAGVTYGALFGYQLNKKWSIETGIYAEKKYYYSEGKYFNTNDLKMPTTWKIVDGSGDCKMFELPVSLKYNFSSHKNSSWFATVGTSSYFMKKESYAFKVYYGSYGPVSHSYSYSDSTKYFFSNLNFSVGYMHRLGNFADLRIEPYLKAPVSGVGVGKLPLLSTGLQVGLTRKF